MSIVYVRVRSKPIRHRRTSCTSRRKSAPSSQMPSAKNWTGLGTGQRSRATISCPAPSHDSILTGKADRNDRSNWRSTIQSARMNAHLLSGTRLAALERDQKDRLAAELAVAKQRIADQRGIITWASTQSPVVLPLRFFNGKVISARDTSAHKATGLEFPVLVDVRSKPVSSAVVLR